MCDILNVLCIEVQDLSDMFGILNVLCKLVKDLSGMCNVLNVLCTRPLENV